MYAVFWGTRGSLPSPIGAAAVEAKIAEALVLAGGRRFASTAEARAFLESSLTFPQRATFGGDSACVEIGAGDRFLVCDLGTGARRCGLDILRRTEGGGAVVVDVLLSHLHWDHIMGLPFFAPAYVPGAVIRIHGCHDDIEAVLRRQQSAPSFPVEFDRMAARFEFVRLQPGQAADVGGFRVTAHAQLHGNDSYGYRVQSDGKAVVYSTDSEHKPGDPAQMAAFVRFFERADLVVFDAQYSLAEAVSVKEDWGHSSNIVGIELCQRAGARRIALFHHDPMRDDADLFETLRQTRRFEEITREDHAVEVLMAYDGLRIEV